MKRETQKNARRAGLVLGAVLTVLSLATFAGASPSVIQTGDLVLSLDGGISPSKVPRGRMAPVALTLDGKVRSKKGGPVPAIRRFVLRTDRNLALDVRGLPGCGARRLAGQTTAAVERRCGRAIVGRGTTAVALVLPFVKLSARSRLLLVNGGTQGRVTNLHLHAYLSAPVGEAIVIPIVATRIQGGPGVKLEASVPVILGGSGSLTDFRLTVNRRYGFEGRRSLVSARCPSGVIDARAEGEFSDGTEVAGPVVWPCRPLGG